MAGSGVAVDHDVVGNCGNSPIFVGRFTYGMENTKVRQGGEGAALKIGSFCSIGLPVTFYLGCNHRTDWSTTYPFGHNFQEELGNTDIKGHPRSRGDIIIGHDVWIGDKVTIMSGVTIGSGAVLAANSHVVKDVLPYQIVGGNPAKLIKDRFSEDIRDLLLELEWWNLPVPVIKEIAPALSKAPTAELIKDLIKRYKVRLTKSIAATVA